MDFSVEDAVPDDLLGEAVWQSVKGPDAKLTDRAD
jgi:hypothetical protein